MKPSMKPMTDLHSPDLDMTGRVDVLVARTVKRIVESNPDPMLKLFYQQFGPVLDRGIHDHLSRFNITATLRKLGLAKPARKPKSRRRSRGEVL